MFDAKQKTYQYFLLQVKCQTLPRIDTSCNNNSSVVVNVAWICEAVKLGSHVGE